jgi:predicted MFS family arabinose efflux permease
VLAVTQVLGAALRIGAGRWSDHVRERMRPLRQLATTLAISLAVTALLLDAPLSLLLPAFVVAGALSLSWNGLAFTATAELAGRARSGAALGFQQTALSVASTGAAPLFASVVDASSWSIGFGLAALFPLAGLAVMRQLTV